MHLRAYLDTLPRGGSTAFASGLGISPVYLLQLAAGQGGRKPSPELCVQIERATGGDVTRRDLRDDWRAIWPELERRSAPRGEKG
jgi:DNA-binding transcriptional regulator YdaS (Cro superfamily)